MKRTQHIVIISILMVMTLISRTASAQGVVIDLEQLREQMTSGKRTVLIDVRSPQEYREGHIPGAINVPAERFVSEQGKLPKGRKTPLIFYCRGAG